MASAMNTYNAEILAIDCPAPKCGAKARNRCRGNVGSQITSAHKARIEAAGWRLLSWGVIVRKGWHPPLVMS